MVPTTQAFSGSGCRACFCGQTLPRSVRAHLRSQRSLRVCAEEGSQTRTEQGTSQSSSNGSGPPQPDQPTENKKQGRRLSFAPNTRSGIGYTEDDSAGQTNIFAVEPKLYLAGSARDVATDPNVNIAIVTAGALALAAIASGLIINFQSKPRAPIEDEPGNYLTLSQYKDKFSISNAPGLQ
ncbi:MAG: hypothetical protein FRX49_02160 [Trebouxia sp. A1-2]|nr:MAG: hypothetical protein FRX49_02160 [Trebouxia sp. A1-2]